MRTRSAFLLALLTAPLATAQTWTTRAPLATARAGAAAAVYDGELWVAGGETAPGQVLRSVERYDPATDTWTPGPALREARADAALIPFDGTLLLIGGVDDDGDPIDDVERYDPGDDRWESFSSLNAARRGLVAFSLPGYGPFAMGGLDAAGSFRADCEALDNGDWYPYPTWSLSSARASLAVATVGSDAYVSGGFTAFGPTGAVERLRADGSQATLPDLLPARGSHAMESVGSYLYVAGGRDAQDALLADAYRLDVTGGGWEPVAALPGPRERVAAASLDGRVYLAGGSGPGGVLRDVVALDATKVDAEAAPDAARFALGAPAPNPTRGRSTLLLHLDRAADVDLALFDLAGRRVRTLAVGPYGAGPSAVSFRTDGLAPGVYAARLQADGRAAVQLVTVVR